MSNLYVTADVVGLESGGGRVTHEESTALKSLGECSVLDRKDMEGQEKCWNESGAPPKSQDPWKWDELAYGSRFISRRIKLAHFYAGTFSRTVEELRSCKAKVTYTAAAHDKDESRREHEMLGAGFHLPHLTEPDLWAKYLQGYLDADVLIVPSRHSEECMRRYGRTGSIKVIPHGCDLPEHVKSRPHRFVVGYLGAIGPDKGLIYLLQAWANLNYKDGSELHIAGDHSKHPWVDHAIQYTQAKNVKQLGWVHKVESFYSNISLYVQPSVSEGFGIEILEAMAHARPVIASTGAGASDLVPSAWTFHPRDVKELALKIDYAKRLFKDDYGPMFAWRDIAEKFTWEKIREMYVNTWRELL